MYSKEIKMCFGNGFITIALLLLVLFTGTLGYLTKTPKNSVVLEGKTTAFTCCSIEQGLLFWKRKSVSSQSTSDINDFSGLLNGFLASGRFNVTRSSSHDCYSLTITGVKREDAGTYACIDNEGLGQSVGWELVILESFECQDTHHKEDFMGANNFGLAQDVITFSCMSIYCGNIPSKPICEWSSGKELHDKYQIITRSNASMTLNIQMPATKEMNKDQLYCYVNIEMESSQNQNPTTRKSMQFRINYAVFQPKTVSRCSGDELSLDCNPPCKTNRFSNGSQFCEIAYPSHTDKKLYVSLQDYDEPTQENVVLILILLVVAIGFFAITVVLTGIVIWLAKKKHGKKATDMPARKNEVFEGSRSPLSGEISDYDVGQSNGTTLQSE